MMEKRKSHEEYLEQNMKEINKMRRDLGMQEIKMVERKCLKCGRKFRAQSGGTGNFLCLDHQPTS